jgi:hypothetical protein
MNAPRRFHHSPRENRARQDCQDCGDLKANKAHAANKALQVWLLQPQQ